MFYLFPALAQQLLSDKWKFRDDIANTAGAVQEVTPKFTVILFQLYVKDDFNA